MELSIIRKLAPIFLILVFTIQACSLPAEIQQDSPVMQVEAGQGNQVRYMTVAANSTPTPTPFQPLKITFTPTPTNTPTLQPTATQTPTPTMAIVAPNQDGTNKFKDVPPGAPLPDSVVNIMVLGSDARPGGGYRTDVIMLVSIDRDSQTVSVVSFPRDLYVNITGWQTNRINTAMEVGGFNTLAATFQNNFGVRPSYYVMTNFNGFKAIIDSMGGIDVKAQKSLKDHCDLPWADGAGMCTINAPATVPMNGADALWYVRSRHSSSDFDRQRRAQEVIRALFVRLMNLNIIPRLPEIFDIYHKNVETNLTLDQVLPLIPVAQEVIKDPNQVQRFALTPSEAIPFVTAEGAMVLWPNLPAIRSIVRQAVYR